MEQEIPAVTLNLGYESSHFTSEDAKEVANFILKNWRNVELVIFQCEEGISRSAGMAMATDEAFNNNAYDIANTPPFCPNMLVYKLMKEEFKIR